MGNRYSTYLTINQPQEFVQMIATDFFEKEGFVYTEYKGENVWKKGNGFLTLPQFIKLDYRDGTVYVDAWLKYAALPGVYCGEMGITGFYAALPKSMLKNNISALMNLLSQHVSAPTTVQQPVYAGGQPLDNTQPVNTQQQYQQQPIPVAVHNPTSRANLALIMGLVSIVSWIIPIAGLITTIIGITSAKGGMKSTSKGKAIAGMVLSIIFLVVTILAWILRIIGIVAGY